MKILITTTDGSLGDVRPLVLLGQSLVQAGHEVSFGVTSHQMDVVGGAGLNVQQIGPSLDAGIRTGMYALASDGKLTHEQQRAQLNRLFELGPQALEDCLNLVQGADLLIGSVRLPLGRIVHELTGVNFMTVSIGHPNIITDELEPTNSWREMLGLPPIMEAMEQGLAPALNIYPISRLLPINTTPWMSDTKMVGFYIDNKACAPSTELIQAVARNRRPVVAVSFGDIVYQDPRPVSQLIADVAQHLNVSIVLSGKGVGLGDDVSLPTNVFRADSASYEEVFQHADCAVHAGESGTTAAGFYAGVPTVIVPHTPEQQEFATFSLQSGCSSAVIPFGELESATLIEAITAAIDDSRFKHSAATVQAQVRNEDGLGQTIQLIDAMFTQCSTHIPHEALSVA
jgi:UDP:flavonoid glycosyltransferase YjiC (YdhE family)